MRKQIFWLVLLTIAGWLLWNLWRQRKDEYTDTLAQLEPLPKPSAPPPPATNSSATPAPASTLGNVVGYCPRCHEKRSISDAHEEITETGRRAARGVCSVCGGNMFTFLKKNTSHE